MTVRITSKGQVTIPREIRERLGLLPDTEVVFEVDGNSVRVRRSTKGTTRGSRIVGRLRGTASRRMTTDEIMAHVREP